MVALLIYVLKSQLFWILELARQLLLTLILIPEANQIYLIND